VIADRSGVPPRTPGSPDHQARPPSAVRAVHGLLGRGRDLVAGLGAAAVGSGVASARRLAGAAGDRPGAGSGPGGDDVRALGVGTLSRWADLDGPVHYLDFGGPAGRPAVVCVHGLAGSAVNWSAIAPLLAGTCRMLAVNLPGHGLTRSQGRGTGIPAMHALLPGARRRTRPACHGGPAGAVAARANPAWMMIEMPGVGHVPQLEAPDDTASVIIGWLGTAAQSAAQAASPASPGWPA
jgi:pimeloyl-ACP methyl ester carboxylesterase